MPWDYWTWVRWSVAASAVIFVLTLFILCVLLWKGKTIFYGIVAKLLNIKRCKIDVHHNIIPKDDNINISSAQVIDIIHKHPRLAKGLIKIAKYGAEKFLSSANAPSNGKSSDPKSDDSDSADEKSDDGSENENEKKESTQKEQQTITIPESDLEHEREILDVYGRYMNAQKRGTLFFIILLLTIIISGAVIAAFNALFLATITVYQTKSCPSIGAMECYCGVNATYFTCDTGINTSCPFDIHISTCFRWIAVDITTSDITTQIGVTAGLLIALGNITEAIIRIYLLAFNKRLNIATGIHRIAAKTIGINRHTANTKCWCCSLPWHCSACNLSLFKNPCSMIFVTLFYMTIPILMFPGVSLLYIYDLSVTALTFIVLSVIAVICVLSIVWILVQESEDSSNIPGGWRNMQTLLQELGTNVKKTGISKQPS